MTFHGIDWIGAAEGVCLDRGSPLPVDCTDIVYTDYASLWEGEGTFTGVSESPVGDIWDGAPTEKGVCTTTGCGPIK